MQVWDFVLRCFWLQVLPLDVAKIFCRLRASSPSFQVRIGTDGSERRTDAMLSRSGYKRRESEALTAVGPQPWNPKALQPYTLNLRKDELQADAALVPTLCSFHLLFWESGYEAHRCREVYPEHWRSVKVRRRAFSFEVLI